MLQTNWDFSSINDSAKKLRVDYSSNDVCFVTMRKSLGTDAIEIVEEVI